jgi:chemotaxis protein methyltransferase CheR
MIQHVHRPLLEDFQTFLKENMGLSFSLNHEKEVIRKIGAIAHEFDFEDPAQCLAWLTGITPSREVLEKLALHLSIGETFFFREPKSFEYLEKVYLPELIRDRSVSAPTLRIWSAGVASGEEIYSLAMLLRKMIPYLPHWKIHLLGTDINQHLLTKARNGIYSKWSFRNRKYSTEEYFSPTADLKFRISDTIRDMVTLSWLNLAEPVYPSPFTNTYDLDIIFCRNVMIYFPPEVIAQVTERFYQCLVKGGILVVSPADMTPYIYDKFSRVIYQGYTIYHKGKTLFDRVDKMTGTTSNDLVVSIPVVKEIDTSPATELPLLELFEHHIPKITPEAPKQEEKAEIQTMNDLSADIIRQLANEGNYDEAAGLCRKALTRRRSDHLLHFLLGTILMETGKSDQAIDAFNKVIYLEQDFIMAHYLLAKLLREKGEEEQYGRIRRNLLRLLSSLNPASLIPESGDLTAGQFLGLVQAGISH